MKILLDTASLEEVRWASDVGIIDGISTDPTLISEEDSVEEYRELLADLCRQTRGPVLAPVLAITSDDIYRDGKELAKIADNIVVEVPVIEDGLRATARLAADGIRVTATLVFSVAQALFAAKAGAYSVSAFMGRLDDIGGDGVSLVRDIRQLFDRHNVECELNAASIRTPRHFAEAAAVGADAAAVPPSVLRLLLVHPLTDLGLDQYLNDWSKHISRSRTSL
ncbi:MAG TPA: transaldolase family protein [Gemmatimonadaceae bacterium]|jgi:transaldolase|nr:transaldolase family protein [Gemmatimonadaceae bacterium]